MTQTNIDKGRMMRWTALSVLLMLFFGNLGGHPALQGVSDQSFSCSIDVDECKDVSSAILGLPALDNVFSDFEEKEEEKEEEEDQFYFYSNFCLPPFSTLFFDKATVAPFVPSQLQVKLFILYQSWKSFLLV